MKKIFVFCAAIIVFACNDSAPSARPGDLDHTDNNDTNPIMKTDSSKPAFPEKNLKRTDSNSTVK